MADLGGLFTSPDEIRANRLDNILANQAATARMGGSMDALLGQVAAGGYNTGALLAEGTAGMFGLTTPEEKKAMEVQKLMTTVKDSNDPDAYFSAAKQLNAMGFSKEALFLTKEGRDIRNTELSYKKNLLEFNELDRLVKAKPELRKILSETDISTPDGRKAAIQAANKVSFETGMEMMKYFQAQDKIKADEQKSARGNYASGIFDNLVDEEGNRFVQFTSLDKTTNKPYVQVVPAEGGVTKPVGKLSIVEQYGETAGDKLGRDIATAGGAVTAKNFAETKTTAVNQIPSLRAQISGIDKAIELAGRIETGGFTNAIANEAQKFFGVTPTNKAEFALRTAEIMYGRLKPLFGGVISDSERAVIERVYATIQQNPEANIALLGVLKQGLEGELSRAENVRDSENFEAYSESTKRSSDTVSWEELN